MFYHYNTYHHHGSAIFKYSALGNGIIDCFSAMRGMVIMYNDHPWEVCYTSGGLTSKHTQLSEMNKPQYDDNNQPIPVSYDHHYQSKMI